jgi:hypothetical protein
MHIVGPPGMGWLFVLLTIKTDSDPNRRKVHARNAWVAEAIPFKI